MLSFCAADCPQREGTFTPSRLVAFLQISLFQYACLSCGSSSRGALPVPQLAHGGESAHVKRSTFREYMPLRRRAM